MADLRRKNIVRDIFYEGYDFATKQHAELVKEAEGLVQELEYLLARKFSGMPNAHWILEGQAVLEQLAATKAALEVNHEK